MKERDYTKELLNSTKRPDDKLHPASLVAILVGFIALIAVVLYGGVWVDALIGLVEIGI